MNMKKETTGSSGRIMRWSIQSETTTYRFCRRFRSEVMKLKREDLNNNTNNRVSHTGELKTVSQRSGCSICSASGSVDCFESLAQTLSLLTRTVRMNSMKTPGSARVPTTIIRLVDSFTIDLFLIPYNGQQTCCFLSPGSFENSTTELTEEESDLVETELEDIKKGVLENEAKLKKYYGENRMSFMFAVMLMFLSFLFYGVYLMMYGHIK
ncbi:hypothetical protein GE061_004582 [Apolygus lucorum]|uniref:Coiled-coil domain-containing protein 167 n=1 Tax=Apolygus lucorum TaxID=248454 RepID=A0A8S9X134_APOLU|nr:hypothetical protein GE061_004582 [Apolygus lucorum]